ncbi:hypothetical protein RV10_GL001818 [Enterococcus pallens]|nr:hypothetical protein RV10_GL001818 [Enterococcus pallens]
MNSTNGSFLEPKDFRLRSKKGWFVISSFTGESLTLELLYKPCTYW